MEQIIFKIGEVSAQLGLIDKNNNTLRGWAEEFGEFLSTMANAQPGLPRRFTPRDVQILTTIRDYRANHLSYDEIRERLHAGEHEVSLPPSEESSSAAPTLDIPSAGSGSQALVPLAQLDHILAPLAASVESWRTLAEEYRTRLSDREERIEALEQRVEQLHLLLERRLDSRPLAEEATLPAQESPQATSSSIEAPLSPVATATSEPAAAPADVPLIFPLPVALQDLALPSIPVVPTKTRRWWQVWG